MILQKHLLDNTERGDLEAFYKSLKALPCGRYEVYICSQKPTRSANQRRYYFGVVVKAISEHTGYNKDEVNEILKFKFNQREIQMPNGLYMKCGSSIEREKRGRCEEIFAEIRKWAAEEMNLQIPEPHEVPSEVYVKMANEE